MNSSWKSLSRHVIFQINTSKNKDIHIHFRKEPKLVATITFLPVFAWDSIELTRIIVQYCIERGDWKELKLRLPVMCRSVDHKAIISPINSEQPLKSHDIGYVLYLMSQIWNISFVGPQLKSHIDHYSGSGTRQEMGVCILLLSTDFPPL